ncbi:HAMP domain-containing sensor histidine kinase [Niallia sp. XMNu-256]|uniref:sensor histidine kinase n=1 Tax=Niallia sp. XMNu-256 TaxID=3082444 RepID=UPI0030D1D613
MRTSNTSNESSPSNQSINPQSNQNLFAIHLAHEVRNPLTTIKGFLQLLKTDLTDQEKNDYVDIAVDEIDRVSILLNQFLSDKNSTFIQQKEVVSLNELVINLIELFEIETKEKKINLTCSLTDHNVLISINQQQLKQVMINLLKNAIEAIEESGKEDGTIDMITEISGQSVFIHICDNGIGMPIKVRDNLFNPFFTTKKFGTGVGLSICQEIIHDSNGQIRVSTEPNKGTKFTIEWPSSK